MPVNAIGPRSPMGPWRRADPNACSVGNDPAPAASAAAWVQDLPAQAQPVTSSAQRLELVLPSLGEPYAPPVPAMQQGQPSSAQRVEQPLPALLSGSWVQSLAPWSSGSTTPLVRLELALPSLGEPYAPPVPATQQGGPSSAQRVEQPLPALLSGSWVQPLAWTWPGSTTALVRLELALPSLGEPYAPPVPVTLQGGPSSAQRVEQPLPALLSGSWVQQVDDRRLGSTTPLVRLEQPLPPLGSAWVQPLAPWSSGSTTALARLEQPLPPLGSAWVPRLERVARDLERVAPSADQPLPSLTAAAWVQPLENAAGAGSTPLARIEQVLPPLVSSAVWVPESPRVVVFERVSPPLLALVLPPLPVPPSPPAPPQTGGWEPCGDDERTFYDECQDDEIRRLLEAFTSLRRKLDQQQASYTQTVSALHVELEQARAQNRQWVPVALLGTVGGLAWGARGVVVGLAAGLVLGAKAQPEPRRLHAWLLGDGSVSGPAMLTDSEAQARSVAFGPLAKSHFALEGDRWVPIGLVPRKNRAE